MTPAEARALLGPLGVLLEEVFERVAEAAMAERALPEPADQHSMTAADVQAYLHVGSTYLDQLTAQGELPHRKVGRTRIYRRADVEAWEQRQIAASTPTPIRRAG